MEYKIVSKEEAQARVDAKHILRELKIPFTLQESTESLMGKVTEYSIAKEYGVV